MSTVTLATVKLRANKTLTADDAEIQAMIDAAEAEYTEFVGPLTGPVTEIHDGGGTAIVLRSPRAAAITAASYTDGSTLTYTDLDLDATTGIVYWKVNTAGSFVSGRRNVSITYTVAAPAANHLEAIAADVAGYFQVTQHSDGAGQADFPGAGGYEQAYTGQPSVLFPRIRALAVPSVA